MNNRGKGTKARRDKELKIPRYARGSGYGDTACLDCGKIFTRNAYNQLRCGSVSTKTGCAYIHQKEYMKFYAIKNPNRQKEWYAKNKEQAYVYHQRFLKKNPEYIKNYSKKHYYKIKDELEQLRNQIAFLKK